MFVTQTTPTRTCNRHGCQQATIHPNQKKKRKEKRKKKNNNLEWGPYKVRKQFLSAHSGIEREKWPTQGQPSWEHAVCPFWVDPPTSPCPTLSLHAQQDVAIAELSDIQLKVSCPLQINYIQKVSRLEKPFADIYIGVFTSGEKGETFIPFKCLSHETRHWANIHQWTFSVNCILLVY